MSGWYSKSTKTVVALAALLQLLDGKPAPIEAAYIKKAIKIWKVYEAHARAIFAQAQKSKASKLSPGESIMQAVDSGIVKQPFTATSLRGQCDLANERIPFGLTDLTSRGFLVSRKPNSGKGLEYRLSEADTIRPEASI